MVVCHALCIARHRLAQLRMHHPRLTSERIDRDDDLGQQRLAVPPSIANPSGDISHAQ